MLYAIFHKGELKRIVSSGQANTEFQKEKITDTVEGMHNPCDVLSFDDLATSLNRQGFHIMAFTRVNLDEIVGKSDTTDF